MIETAESEKRLGSDTTNQNIYLAGFPTLSDFHHFARNHAVDSPDEATLTQQWESAKKIVHSLKEAEPGVADDPPIEQLGPSHEALLIEFLKDPLVRNSFNTGPTE